jgi:prephenate dehydratase
MNDKIAIQGGVASFHDIATSYFFEEEKELVCCKTFRDLCEQLKSGKADLATMAIENSIAGSILNNYVLIRQYGFHIIGEISLRIEQNLMALPGVKLEEVEVVRSHYMALGQCEEFILKHPNWISEEYYDTADSAKNLAADVKKEGRQIAAVASRKAAEVYGLTILGESIETVKENYTKFVILSRDKQKIAGANKATISFQLPDRVGTLSEMLQLIVKNNVNLTRIQSVPIIGKPGEYMFYVDCEWQNYEDWKRCIGINSIAKDLKVLGEYKKGETIHDYSLSR